MNIKAILKALFAVTVWGASFVATKIALQYVAPTTLVWMRFAMGVAILGLAVGLSKQFSLPKGKDWGYFALLGFLGITFHQWLQSTALVTAQASTTSWIVASSPMFMAILGVIFLKEYLVWHQIAGIILAAFGVLVVVSKGDLSTVSTGNFGSPGDLLNSDQCNQLGRVFNHLPTRSQATFTDSDDVLCHEFWLVVFVRSLLNGSRYGTNLSNTLGWLACHSISRCILFRHCLYLLVRCIKSSTRRPDRSISVY